MITLTNRKVKFPTTQLYEITNQSGLRIGEIPYVAGSVIDSKVIHQYNDRLNIFIDIGWISSNDAIVVDNL